MFGNALQTGGNHFVARVRGDTNIESFEELMEVIDQGCVLALITDPDLGGCLICFLL